MMAMSQTEKPWFPQSLWHAVTPSADRSVGGDQSEEQALAMWRPF
jgi:hypothetical protein